MQSNYPDRSSKGLIATSLDLLAPIVTLLERLGCGGIGRSATSGTIRLYQQYVSPHKGFSCAHRRLYGEISCSEYFRQTVLTQGFSAAVPLFQQRLAECQQANLRLRSQADSTAQSQGDIDAESIDSSDDSSEPQKKTRNSSSWDCGSSSCGSADCSGCEIPHFNACDHAHHGTIGGCDAGACDFGAFDAGGCDAGGCDVGGCDCNF